MIRLRRWAKERYVAPKRPVPKHGRSPSAINLNPVDESRVDPGPINPTAKRIVHGNPVP